MRLATGRRTKYWSLVTTVRNQWKNSRLCHVRAHRSLPVRQQNRLWGSSPCFAYRSGEMKSASASIEALMTELRAASADLAKSATVGTSRMVLRFKLSNAIRDAEKAERAAENLRAAASAIVSGHEQTGLVPDPRPDIEMEGA